MNFKQQIENEIKNRKEIYKTSPSDMISAYNREVETEKEYNGRQLLELIQNADDEQSTNVEIKLNTENHTLIISNSGKTCKPFSFEGIRSLMISNLSSKINKKFIGNKGLGFRSIINWSEKITITSNNLDITFSRDIVDKIFDTLFTKEEKLNIKKDSKYKNTNSIPFLSIPNLEENHNNSKWTTSVTITYKSDYLEDIQKQLNELKNEILLFLNHINTLIVIIDNEEKLNINKHLLIEEYQIYDKREKLPIEHWDNESEEEFFDLKIALKNNLQNDIKELFAYFPTKIDINFPFIVHGTFELNSSRNEIIDGPKNRYILKQLVELIITTAKELTKDEVSYKALEILSYKTKNNILNELGFYQFIDNAIEELEIYPCLDRKYRKMADVIFIDELSIFVMKINKEHIFSNLLIPKTNNINLDNLIFKKSIDTNKLNQLSQDITSIIDRANLIYMFYNTFKHENKLIFLIDENQDLISLNDDVYTPSKNNFSLPNFVKIKFIHKELFNKLVEKFDIKSLDKARELQRKLKEITNIQSYEPAPILQKIVSSTNKELKKDNINKIEIIKEMVQSLYKNYISLNEPQKIRDVKIQLLNKNNELYDAQKLYLSESYPSGKLTAFLFNDIIPTKEFLTNINTFDFKDEILEETERFFIWLGVNKYTQFTNQAQYYHYINFVFTKIQKPNNYRDASVQVKEIFGFKKLIEKLPLEKIILWFLLDDKIKIQLENNTNSDLFKYSKKGEYSGYYNHTLTNQPSYILYQIISSGIFKDYLITNEKLSQIANKTTINFNDDLFKKYNIGEHTIKALLLKLGAVEKFEDLSIERIKEILKELPNTTPDGKQTQTIYKSVRNHKDRLYDKSIKLCAKKNNELGYYNQNEIYYVNTHKLPKNILNDIAIINIPPRLGNITKFFGIKDVKEIKIEIKDYTINKQLHNEFINLIEKLKLYILAYRFETLRDEKTKEDETKKLKDMKIVLCNSITYQKDSITHELSNNDYLINDKEYYIQVEGKFLKDIIETLDFRETFSDIIGSVFNITNIENFTRIVSDKIEETEEIIKRKLGEEALQEAREYLNIADEFSSFWRVIYKLKAQQYNDKYTIQNLDIIKKELGLNVNIEDIDYQSLSNYEVIQKIFNELKIDIHNFNNKAYYKLDFREYHNNKLKDEFNNNLYKFKQLLYKYCKDNKKEKEFLNLIGKYENYICDSENILEIDYQKIVNNFIQKEFEFNLTDTYDEMDLDNIYDKNKKLIDFEKIEFSNEYRSLLYFEDKLDEIKNYIISIQPKEIEIIEEITSTKVIYKDIIPINLSTPKNISKNQIKSTNPYRVSSSQNKRKKQIGDSAEEEVFNSLKKEFGIKNVEWISKNDDTQGYDIKYKNKDNEWKYVEVKTYSKDIFYLSKSEKEFADRHKGNYEIFLVGNEIYRIEDIDFKDTSKFKLETDSYKVYYTKGN